MIETIKAANGRYIDYEVIEDKCDFIPGQEVSIQDCVNRGLVPVEATNLEYDSDENGENVSFDDAHPIIPDKIAALERLQSLERDCARAKANKEAADKAAAEAQKMAAAVGNPTSTAPATRPVAQPATQPSD